VRFFIYSNVLRSFWPESFFVSVFLIGEFITGRVD